MRDVNAYLIFDGNCRQAMSFYEKCLGAKAQFMPFSETPCRARFGMLTDQFGINWMFSFHQPKP